jgi:hypothetical protein
MAEKTTLLSYETAWQFRLFDLMTASQQAGNYFMACTYGKGLLKVLGITEIPPRELGGKLGTAEDLRSYEQWYTDILMTSLGKIKGTIDSVRAYYQKDKTIPSYKAPQGKK